MVRPRSFTQSGGVNAVSNFIGFGDGVGSSGAYSLTGGTVSALSELIFAGSFAQSGGVHLVMGNLQIADGNVGSYNLSGSGVLSAQQEQLLGEFGNATFTQSGGSNLISGSLSLSQSGTGVGNYNLSGGLLRLSSLISLGGSTAFNFSGGTIQLLAGFSASQPITLNTPVGIGTLDTNGNTVTLTNTFSGTGSLNKGGAGTLTLNSTQGYSGPTIVSGGTLALPYDIPSSSFTAAGGGVLQFPGATLNLNSRFIRAMAGGTVVYQDATINGGFLRGPGTHVLSAGSATTLNDSTIDPATIVQQAGNDSFFNVTNRGQVTNNGYLTLSGGINDGGSGLIVNGTADVSEWINAGVITVNNGGQLNNHYSILTSYGGARIYVNSGGTLNADSQSEGVSLDLQDSLLVNNGRVTGTTNVYYGATVSGSGSFGPINVMQAGAVVAAATAVPMPTSLTVTSGSISGSGNLAVSATVADAILATPNLTDTLTLSGNLSGPGPITKIGAGTLILSGTNTYGTGTNDMAGTLVVANSYSLPDGSNLSVGGGIAAFGAPVVPLANAAAAVVPVPEPGTLVLLAIGACGAVVYRSPRSRWKE